MFDNTIRQIKERYNADNDVVPGQPIVSWTDYKLLEMIESLSMQVETFNNSDDNLMQLHEEYEELNQYCDALKQLLRESMNALDPSNTEPIDLKSLIDRISRELR